MSEFTPDEQRALAPYFSNLDGPVFALTNLPETVKGALFARYSRSAKSLRRLFLDEFLGDVPAAAPAVESHVGVERAEKLYARVFSDYGDDSVAQLGGVHLACEGVSNMLTKVIEWGRLMAYLEQSTRYVPYTDRPGGRWKYHVPKELEGTPLLARYHATLDRAFEIYARWFEPMQEHFRARFPKEPADSDGVYRAAIRAKALDTLRGLLPGCRAVESRPVRHRAGVRGAAAPHARQSARRIAGLRRPDSDRAAKGDSRVPDARRSARSRRALDAVSGRHHERRPTASRDRLLADVERESRPEVGAHRFRSGRRDQGGRGGALRRLRSAGRPAVRRRAAECRPTIAPACCAPTSGDRGNRRHKPGRAFERTTYRFDVLADYGAFRDLQRHRLLTLEWQPLGALHGYVEPDAIEAAGAHEDWTDVMDASAELHDSLHAAGLSAVAPYAVSMAYRVRFYMEMNAREAMHLIELRTAPQGHPAYRRICQAMHTLIAEQAGHRSLADAMKFVDHSEVELERLKAERAAETRRHRAGSSGA